MGEVGKEQAKALEKVDVKIIANAGGTISHGISKVTGTEGKDAPHAE